MRNNPIPSTPTHITYRLYGSIPNLGLSTLHENDRLRKVRIKEKYPPDMQASDLSARRAFTQELLASERQMYLTYDGLLDRARTGPRYLAGTNEKRIVLDSWMVVARQFGLRIFAISVMSNHVHVLLENKEGSRVPLEHIMQQHKRFTATQLNRLHQQPGRRVWAEREYSRTVRYGNFERTLWYVLNNPVKAGLTDDAASWSGNWYSEEVATNFVMVRAKAG